MNNKGYEKVTQALNERLGKRTYRTVSQHFEEPDGYSARFVSLGPLKRGDANVVDILSALHDNGLMASDETRVVHSDTPQFKFLGIFNDSPTDEGEPSQPTVLLEDLNA